MKDRSWGNGGKSVVMNYLSLNIRGVTGYDKLRWVRSLKSEGRCSFLALQETHLAAIQESFFGRFWGRSRFEVASVDAVGRSGGLACLWDPDVFKMEWLIKNQYFLLISGHICRVEENVNIMNIYAPNDQVKRRELWDQIVEIKAQTPGMRVILGDFNDVRTPDERVNSRFDPLAAAFFNNFISNAGLLEYNMSGGRFTYISDNVEIKMSKLDRFLVCEKFLNEWPMASLSVLKKGA